MQITIKRIAVIDGHFAIVIKTRLYTKLWEIIHGIFLCNSAIKDRLKLKNRYINLSMLEKKIEKYSSVKYIIVNKHNRRIMSLNKANIIQK